MALFEEGDSPDVIRPSGCDAICWRFNGRIRSERATMCAGFDTLLEGDVEKSCLNCRYGTRLRPNIGQSGKRPTEIKPIPSMKSIDSWEGVA